MKAKAEARYRAVGAAAVASVELTVPPTLAAGDWSITEQKCPLVFHGRPRKAKAIFFNAKKHVDVIHLKIKRSRGAK